VDSNAVFYFSAFLLRLRLIFVRSIEGSNLQSRGITHQRHLCFASRRYAPTELLQLQLLHQPQSSRNIGDMYGISQQQGSGHSHTNPSHDTMSDVGSDIMTVTDLHTLSGLSSSDPHNQNDNSTQPTAAATNNAFSHHVYPSNGTMLLPPPPPVSTTDNRFAAANDNDPEWGNAVLHATSIGHGGLLPAAAHRHHGTPSLHDVDAETMVSGSDVHTVNDDIFTVDMGTNTGHGIGTMTLSNEGSGSEVYDRHAASLGQAQYTNGSDDYLSKMAPSEPGATRGSTTGPLPLGAADHDHPDWNGPSAPPPDATAAAALGTGGFWSRTFRKHHPTTTMPSEDDEENEAARVAAMLPAGTTTTTPNQQQQQGSRFHNPQSVRHTKMEPLTPPPALIIVGGSSHHNRTTNNAGAVGAGARAGGAGATFTSRKSSAAAQSQYSDESELVSVWKQRLCGLRADRLVVLLLLVLLVAVAVIVGAIVVTQQTSSSSSSSSSSNSLNDNANNNDPSTLLDRGNEIISLTRTPTENGARAPSTPKATAPVKAPATTPPLAVTEVPTVSDQTETLTPTVTANTDMPSPMPSACSFARDDTDVVFPVGTRDRNCTWLANRPADRNRQCGPGKFGFEFCRATCGNCQPLPSDGSRPWPERCGGDSDAESFVVEDNTVANCAWLSSAGTLLHKQRLCQVGSPAFMYCRETCRNCGREVVSDPPSQSPSAPIAEEANATLAPTATPIVETASPTLEAANNATEPPNSPAPTRITPAPTVALPAPPPTSPEPSPAPVTTTTPPPTQSQTTPAEPPSTPTSVEELEALVLTVAPNSQDRLSNVDSDQFRALVWVQERLSGQAFGDVSTGRIIQKWAMTTFAFRINWDQQWLNSGNDECTWTGITCNDSGEVTAIVLDNRGIQGDFPPELSLLSQLERLIVSENSFSGDIPGSFGDLRNLQDFRMDRNEFTGELPQSIGGMASLRIWYMERNVNLGGTFPESVLELRNLQELVFYYTSITGELPTGVCSLGLASLILDCRQVQSDCWTQCFYRCGGETGVACGDGNDGS
jgi:hypothetical protein